jgi:hypothetical protein
MASGSRRDGSAPAPGTVPHRGAEMQIYNEPSAFCFTHCNYVMSWNNHSV